MFFAYFLELFSSSRYNKGRGVFTILRYLVGCVIQKRLETKECKEDEMSMYIYTKAEQSVFFLYLCLDHQFFEVSFPGVTGCSYSFCIIYSASKAKKNFIKKKKEINFSRTSLIFSYYLMYLKKIHSTLKFLHKCNSFLTRFSPKKECMKKRMHIINFSCQNVSVK